MKKKLRYMLSGVNISGPALFVIRLSMKISCAVLVLSLLTHISAGPMTAENVYIYRLAADLYRAPLGVLLTAFLGALIIDALIKEGR